MKAVFPVAQFLTYFRILALEIFRLAEKEVKHVNATEREIDY